MGTDLTPMVVEFLLRRSPDDRVVNDVLQFHPLPENDSRLQKVLLLRKIESEISKGSVSEKILGFLELIEESEHENGVAAPDSLKLAYCAVAVECTFRCLDEPTDGDKKFFFAVKRIWKGRILKMERSEKGGLLSDELLFWRKEIEEAVWDSSVCENVRPKSRKIDALGAVKSYLAEGWGSLGPSLLELEFGKVDDDTLKKVLKLCNNMIQDQIGEKGVFLGSSCPDPALDNTSKDIERNVVLPRRRSSLPRRCRDAKITSQDESEVGTSTNNSLPTPILNDIQQTPQKNSMDPQTAPTNPLSGVLQLAEDIIAGAKAIGTNGEGSIEGNSGVDFPPPNPCLGKSTEDGPANEANRSRINDSVSQNGEVAVVDAKPPTGMGRQKKGKVVKGESEEKVEVEVRPVYNNTRRTRSSTKAESSNVEPDNASNQIGDRPQRGRPRRKLPLPEVAENAGSEVDGDNAAPPPPPPPVCENVGENVVQSKQADSPGVSNVEVTGHPEMEVSGHVGGRPKRGGGRRKNPLPKVAENVVSEDAEDKAGPPSVCENAGDLNKDGAGRSNLEQEEHQESDLQVENVGIVPPTLSKQGRQMGTRRTRRTAKCSNLEESGYPEMELTGQVGIKPKQIGAKRSKQSSEVINNVASEDADVNVEVPNLGSPHVSENARENIVENEAGEAAAAEASAAAAGREDLGTSNLGGEKGGLDYEKPPDLEKMTVGDWFDYLEVYLPQQINKETEEIIASMKQKADLVYEYKLKHKEDGDKGRVNQLWLRF